VKEANFDPADQAEIHCEYCLHVSKQGLQKEWQITEENTIEKNLE